MSGTDSEDGGRETQKRRALVLHATKATWSRSQGGTGREQQAAGLQVVVFLTLESGSASLQMHGNGWATSSRLIMGFLVGGTARPVMDGLESKRARVLHSAIPCSQPRHDRHHGDDSAGIH